MIKREYFSIKKHEALQNKSMIHVFKKSFWFHNLIWWKGYALECYTWKEENDMIIISEKKKCKEEVEKAQ